VLPNVLGYLENSFRVDLFPRAKEFMDVPKSDAFNFGVVRNPRQFDLILHGSRRIE